MNVLEAQVTHRSAVRLRVRIPARRGDEAYFERLVEVYAGFPGVRGVQANPATASVLFLGDAVDPEAIEQRALDEGLFTLAAARARPAPGLPNRSVEPLKAFDSGMKRMTGGRLNLPGFVFYGLLGTAAYQIFRGRFGAPPWYTAFWYAFGVYSKQLADGGDGDAVEPE